MSIEAIRSRISEIEARVGALRAGPSSMQVAATTKPGGVSAMGFESVLQQTTPAQSDTRSGVNKLQFATDVLQRIGAPVTSENVKAMSAWIDSEGTRAQFNPLATVRKAPGATDFNTTGVKNFVSYEQGVETTVGAITNGLYGNVIAAFRKGDDAYAVADAIANSPWGSGALVRKVLKSRES
jgi:hypothetical protein